MKITDQELASIERMRLRLDRITHRCQRIRHLKDIRSNLLTKIIDEKELDIMQLAELVFEMLQLQHCSDIDRNTP